MDPLDFSALFPNYNGILDFEVGFGRAVFLESYAKHHPQRCIVGIEVRKQLVTICERRLQKEGIKNARVLHGNAQICLEDAMPDKVIENVFVFHPDPWFKKRHHKRRVVNSAFLDVLSKKMTSNGTFYLSTDVKELWEDMMKTILSHGGFKPLNRDSFWEQFYKTHWQLFSEKDERETFRGVFQLAISLSEL